jgi:hypothetical protein
MLVAFSIIAVLAFVAERLWPARPQALFRPGLFTDGMYLVINIVLRIAITNTLAIAVSRVGQQLLPHYTVAVLSDAVLGTDRGGDRGHRLLLLLDAPGQAPVGVVVAPP